MPKKILFHAEQLNLRGTTNSILEYAKYNQEILGNESAIMYSASNPDGVDVGTDESVVDQLRGIFPLYTYSDFKEANEIASNFDLCYSQRAGLKADFRTREPQLIIDSTKFGVHSVFQWYDPHGDRYAYISEWLAKMLQNNHGFLMSFTCHPQIMTQSHILESAKINL